MNKKIRLLYNANCSSCLPYVDYVVEICESLALELEKIEINNDIFTSIEAIVECRMKLDPHINQLPIVEILNNDQPIDAFVGIHDYMELFRFISKSTFL